ncbi:methyltransferase [Streptomyces albofaciens JCM 4342]|uniref:class I SAM-dependent DNA methyltransferase n=1 Tax=Streptomyces albofaciens TaxID=66866 RepID=UPI001238AA7E|nr:class I SAM-dependent methyltransferase [Streptomyces albofaciens]KAA6214893.1 methyltransferase [Streptomyces albofaciens JCM 4342]
MPGSPRTSVSAEHFDKAYRSRTDPWGTLHKPYEQEKFADTASLLPAGRFRSALEIGCGVGALTRLLAPHCDHLLATDCSTAAVEQARQNCADLPHLTFATLRVPEELDAGSLPASLAVAPVDLIVMSEVGYYLSAPDLGLTAARIAALLGPGGHVLLAHWVHDEPDTAPATEAAPEIVTGHGVHKVFRDRADLRPIEGRTCHRHGNSYRLDLFQRVM